MQEGGGGAYLEPWGIRALTIIDYWSRGPLHFLRNFKDIESVSPKKHAKRVVVIKNIMCVLDIQE